MAQIGAQFVNAVSPNPVGSLQAYAGASAPTGWLLCDGTSYTTAAYPELYSVLGYTYGGSGSNFNVPDLHGRMPMGAGTGVGLNSSGTGAPSGTAMTARTRGQWGGAETHTLSAAEMPSHTHTVNASYQTGLETSPGGGYGVAGTQSQNTGSAGSGSAHNNVQPFIVTNYIIKAIPDAPRSGLAYGSTPPIVTQLPANPQFGEVVTYIADAANGVAWNLQYDASGTYPWKFIGGSPLRSFVGTVGVQTTINTFQNLSGPSVTAPLAGDYDCFSEAGVNDVSNQILLLGINAAGTVVQSARLFISAFGGGQVSLTYRATGLASSSVVRPQFYTNVAQNASYGWSASAVSITPIRVKAP